VDDAAENALVNSARGSEGEIYLGASDLGAGAEGIWSWEGGDVFWRGAVSGMAEPMGRYINWASGEPNGGTGENCAELRSDAKWQDNNCDNQRAFMCESP